MGFWSMVGAGAPVIGVVVGGPLVETFGWRAIFIAQVPLTLIGLRAGVAGAPRDRPRSRPGRSTWPVPR